MDAINSDWLGEAHMHESKLKNQSSVHFACCQVEKFLPNDNKSF